MCYVGCVKEAEEWVEPILSNKSLQRAFREYIKSPGILEKLWKLSTYVSKPMMGSCQIYQELKIQILHYMLCFSGFAKCFTWGLVSFITVYPSVYMAYSLHVGLDLILYDDQNRRQNNLC